MPLEGALNPQVWYLATPPSSTHPKLGVRGTRGFTVVPLKGFLGPSYKAADLTRILHRHSVI